MNRKLYLFVGLLLFICIISIFVDSFKILDHIETYAGTIVDQPPPAGVTQGQPDPSKKTTTTYLFNNSEPDNTTILTPNAKSLKPPPPTPKV